MFSNTLKRHRQQTRMNFPLNVFNLWWCGEGTEELLAPLLCLLCAERLTSCALTPHLTASHVEGQPPI